MAITIDDILGKNTREAEAMGQDSRYYTAPEMHKNYIPTVEEVRDREAARAYSAPSHSEFKDTAFNTPIFDSAQTREQSYAQQAQYGDNRGDGYYRSSNSDMYASANAGIDVGPSRGGYANPDMGYARSMGGYDVREQERNDPYLQNATQDPSSQDGRFFGFNAAENGMNAQDYLYRLGNTSSNQFDPASEYDNGFANQNFNDNKQRNRSKAKRKIDLKGKIIIGLYLAVAVVAITLIAVNASKINNGTALAPTSAIADTSNTAFID